MVLTMKKAILVVLAVVLVSTGIYGVTQNNKKTVYKPLNTIQLYYAGNISDLENGSDAVVLTRVLPGSVNIIPTPSASGYTLTELEVLQVFEGDVKVGSVLTITEEYYTIETLTEKQIRHTENYGPSTTDQEYLFFLKKYNDSTPEFSDMYFPYCVEKGRYPVFKELLSNDLSISRSIDDYANFELNLGFENSAVYRDIFEDVKENYFNKIISIN